MAVVKNDGYVESLKLGLRALENAVRAVLVSRGISIKGGVDVVDVLESLSMYSLSNEVRRYRDLLSSCSGSTCDHDLVVREINKIEGVINNALNMVVHNIPHLGP